MIHSKKFATSWVCKVLCMVLLFVQLGCNDNDDLEDRLDKLETEVNDLKTAISTLQNAYDNGKIVSSVEKITTGNGGWKITFSDNTYIDLINGANGKDGVDGVGTDGKDGIDGKNGTDIIRDIIEEDNNVTFILSDGTAFKFALLQEPKLLSFVFTEELNAMQIVDDAECTISNDVVECTISNIMLDKNLIPLFTFRGDSVVIDGKKAESGKSSFDFRQQHKAIVYSGNKDKSYNIRVQSYTHLPILWLDTEAAITSKEVYVSGTFQLYEDIATLTDGKPLICDVNVKGRGNSTWGMPKKPYAIKFNEKQSVLGEAKDKSWVLLANYSDKTMIRTSTAMYMGSISNLDYTPHFHFVELMLNGRYNGTYLLGEKLKIGKNRVNVGDDGFLLEIDAKAAAEDITFKVAHIGHVINIKDPDVEVDDENYNYVKDYVSAADAALYSTNFTDPDEGYQKYIDMDSFVDWGLINEITKNNDAVFYTSCYMNLARGGKLKMGPLWDFDISLGNINYNGNDTTDGLYILKKVKWYTRLMQDPAFVARVKERFDYFYGHKNEIISEINKQAKYLHYAVEENENKWGTFYTYTWPNNNIWGSYQNEVESLKVWLNARFEWLKGAFDAM